jgi:hypothetical protein
VTARTTKTRTTTTESRRRTDQEAGSRAGLRRVGALFALVAIFAAGCVGGDARLSKAEYEEKVQEVYAGVQAAFAATNVPSLDEMAERVADAQDELREAAGELEGITPPEEAEAANAQIAEGLRLYADELDRLRLAAERGDQHTIDDFNAHVADRQSVRQIMEAAEAMKFKGYDLGPIAEE